MYVTAVYVDDDVAQLRCKRECSLERIRFARAFAVVARIIY